jgi:hypothetical protein
MFIIYGMIEIIFLKGLSDETICNKQAEVYRFCFCLQKKTVVPFSSPFFYTGIPGTWRHGHGDMETGRHLDMDKRHGNKETWRCGDIETWRHGDMEKWRHGAWRHRHGNIKRKKGNQNLGRFSIIPLPFAHHANRSLLFVRLWTQNKRKLSLCRRT